MSRLGAWVVRVLVLSIIGIETINPGNIGAGDKMPIYVYRDLN